MLGGTTGLLGSMLVAPQSAYLNLLYNAGALLSGKPAEWTYNMNGLQYADKVARLFG